MNYPHCTGSCAGRRRACDCDTGGQPDDDFAFARPLVLRLLAVALLAVLLAFGSIAWPSL